MKELYRHSMFNCEPIGSLCLADAEIALEDDDGQPVYLHAQWGNEQPETVFFDATTSSVYRREAEIYEDPDSFDLEMALLDARMALWCKGNAEEIFADEWKELTAMICRELLEAGYEEEDFFYGQEPEIVFNH